jgi:protein-disulfide isomerase
MTTPLRVATGRLALPVGDHDHAAEAAGMRGLFWAVHDWLYRHRVRSGVRGTPTFFVNGLRHDGAHRLAGLAAAVDRAAIEQ